MSEPSIRREIVPQRPTPLKIEDMSDIVAQAVVESVFRKLESGFHGEDTGREAPDVSDPPAGQASTCPHLRALKGCIANPEQLFVGMPGGPDDEDDDEPCSPEFVAELETRLEMVLKRHAAEGVL